MRKEEKPSEHLASGLTSQSPEIQASFEALGQQLDFAESIIETTRAITLVLDTKGRVVRINRYMEELTGHKLAEIKGKDYTSLFLPADKQQEVRDKIAYILSGHKLHGYTHPIKVQKGDAPIIEWHASALYSKSQNLIGLMAVGYDVTQHHKTEAILRRQARTFENMFDAAILTDANGQIIDWNPAATRMFGYSREEALGQSPTIFHHPDYMPQLQDQILTKIQQGERWQGEVPFIRKDGIEGILEANITPLMDKSGNFIGSVGVNRDITQRKAAEEALRKSEERFELAIKGSNDGIWDRPDINKDQEWWSPRCFELLGYQEQEIEPLHSTLVRLLHPDDKDLVSKAMRAHIKDHTPYDLEYRLRTKAGEYRWFHVRAQAVWDEAGTPTRIAGSIQDITERKTAKEERERLLRQVQEQAQQIRQIIDTVPEGVLLLNAEHRVILANPLAKSYRSALAPDHDPSRSLAYLGNRAIEEILQPSPGGIGHRVESMVPPPRAFNVIAEPIESDDTAGNWVMVLRDITRELEVQQKAQQQERLAAVGQLAAGIAHDFNNIMATIILYTQIMLRTTSPFVEENRERLRGIEQQAQHATHLIQQILDFSRRTVLKRQQLDLWPFLKEQVRLLERTLPETITITIEKQGTDDSFYDHSVAADPTRVQQIIMNLALNARDAMPQGGDLKITMERIPADAKADPDAWIQITVADTGVGIPKETLPHIFEPFFTTKPVGQGTGLGLPQVLGIVKQHGGEIDVDSQVGRGTTFTITLPALPTPQSEPEADKGNTLIQGNRETILLVEDNKATREAMCAALELLNYNVLTAAHGQEALQILGNNKKIDLLLTDIVMPKMGGIALIHAVQQQDFPLKIIVISGHPMNDELEKLRSEIVIPLLSKPVSLDKLAAVINQTLHTSPKE